ncbi:hypothetical protein D3C71_79780 [compost metagenome]
MQASLKNNRPIGLFSRSDQAVLRSNELRVRNRLRDIQGLEYVLKGGSFEDLAKKWDAPEKKVSEAMFKLLSILGIHVLREHPGTRVPSRRRDLEQVAGVWLEHLKTYHHLIEKPVFA